MNAATCDYDATRHVFARFKVRMDSDEVLRSEFIEATRALLNEYSTTIRENRFVVGGAVEHFVGAAMRASGLLSRNRGHLESGWDICHESAGFSVKACFQKGLANIGLINTQGGSAPRAWVSPTVLVLAGRGIGYVDPEVLPNATVSRSDQLLLPKKAYLPYLKSHPEHLIALDVPHNPRNPATRVASYAVAEEILGRLHFHVLRLNRTSASW